MTKLKLIGIIPLANIVAEQFFITIMEKVGSIFLVLGTNFIIEKKVDPDILQIKISKSCLERKLF